MNMNKTMSMLAAVLVAVSLCQELAAQAPSAFEGTVFYDKDQDGIRDKGERGAGGVAVTDGFSVALTDKDGRFRISPAPKARFITVCTPDGHRNTNRFFCDVRGIMSGEGLSGGELNRANPGLDFGIVRCRQYGSFSHMSDIEDRRYYEWIDRMKEYSAVHDQDFIVETGDICYENGLLLFAEAMNDENMGRRMVYTIGNHDLIRGSKDYLGNDYGEKLFEDCFGPSWYSFTAAGVHFIVTPMLMGDARPSYSADEIRAWIQEDLKTIPQGMPVMMFNHDAAEKLVPDNANVKAFIYGHRHFDLRTTSSSGLAYYCSMSPGKGSNDHSAAALREFKFDREGTVTTRMHYGPVTNHAVAHEVDGSVKSVIYDSASEAVKAEVVLDNGKRIRMNRINDMMWEARLREPLAEGSVYSIAAEFSDGDRIVARQEQEPGLEWMTALPGKTCFTDPVISGGHLYIATMDNENGVDCAVLSLDASNGEVEWKCPVRNSIKGDIALVDGVIYAGDVDYNAYAINANDGSVIWTRRVAEKFYPSFTEGVHVAGGLMFMGTGVSLCALDVKTGETVWTNSHNHDSITNVCTDRTADGALLTNGYWVGRFCYDAATGDFLWEKRDYDNRYSSSTPAVVGDTFVYTGYAAIMQVAARTGEVLKCQKFPYIFNTRSEPLVTGGRIFVGTSNNGFLAVNMEDMSQAWNFQTEPALIYTSPYTQSSEKTVESSPAAFGEYVVFGANDGNVYCLRQRDGKYLWQLRIGLPVISKPQIVGGRMFLSDFAGNIYCYRIAE